MDAREMTERLDAALARSKARAGLDALERRMAEQAEARSLRNEAAELRDVATRLDAALRRAQSPRRSAVEEAAERWATRKAGVMPRGHSPGTGSALEEGARDGVDVGGSIRPGMFIGDCDPSVPVGSSLMVTLPDGRRAPVGEHTGGGRVRLRDDDYCRRVLGVER